MCVFLCCFALVSFNFHLYFCSFFCLLPLPPTGIINRGDSFRRRRSRSNSLAPVSPIHPRVGALAGCTDMDVNLNDGGNHQQQVDVFHVEMLGAPGVGKQALVSQFRTSDCINAYDGPGKVENK